MTRRLPKELRIERRSRRAICQQRLLLQQSLDLGGIDVKAFARALKKSPATNSHLPGDLRKLGSRWRRQGMGNYGGISIGSGTTIKCYQIHNGLRVESGTLVFWIDGGGDFAQMHGAPTDPTSLPQTIAPRLVAAQDRISMHFGGRMVQWHELGFSQLLSREDLDDNVAAERVIDPDTGDTYIVAQNEHWVARLNEQTGEITTRSGAQHGTSYASIRKYDWAADGSASGATSNGGQYVYRADFYPNCYYYLKYGVNEAWDYAIQVEDAAGPELVDFEPFCNYTPNFTSSVADNLEEQNAYYYAKALREFWRSNIFSRVIPDSDHKVTIWVDSAHSQCPGKYGVYDNSWDVHICTNGLASGPEPQTIAILHEMGHYFIDLMGGNKADNCNPGYQSDSVEEAIAEVTILIHTAETHPSTLQYRVPGAALEGVAELTDAHKPENPKKLFYVSPSACEANPTTYGNPFRQAFWEILNGADCEQSDCSSEAAVDAANYMGWVNHREAARVMGRALAYATDSTGSNVSYPTVVTQMYLWIAIYEPDATLAAKVLSVFDHHGF